MVAWLSKVLNTGFQKCLLTVTAGAGHTTVCFIDLYCPLPQLALRQESRRVEIALSGTRTYQGFLKLPFVVNVIDLVGP